MAISRDTIEQLFLPLLRLLPDEELKDMDGYWSTYVLHERVRKRIDDKLFAEMKKK